MDDQTPQRESGGSVTANTEPKRYWFPAKRNGWGWGLPTWRGWAFLASWWLTVTLLTMWLVINNSPFVLPFIIVMSWILLAIAFAKAEPTRLW